MRIVKVIGSIAIVATCYFAAVLTVRIEKSAMLDLVLKQQKGISRIEPGPDGLFQLGSILQLALVAAKLEGSADICIDGQLHSRIPRWLPRDQVNCASSGPSFSMFSIQTNVPTHWIQPDTYLVLHGGLNPALPEIVVRTVLLSILVFIGFLLFAWRRRELRQIVSLLDQITAIDGETTQTIIRGWSRRSQFSLHQQINLTNARLSAWANTLARHKSNAAVAEAADHVAHDIKSPLTALSYLALEIPSPSDEMKQILRKAVHRIESITSDLTKARRSQPVLTRMQTPQMVFCIIQDVIAEKRAEAKAFPGASILFHPLPSHYGLFSCVDASALKRALSNLINNSLTASKRRSAATGEGEHVNICVSLTSDRTTLSISVVDDAGGVIPDAPRGTCLGHKTVKVFCETMGGSFAFDSFEGKGCTALLTLPLSAAAPWYANELTFSAPHKVTVLDDDPVIHNIWATRIGKNIDSYFGASSFLSACPHPTLRKPDLYLIDLELKEEALSGLDVIDQAGLAGSAVLVTTRFDEQWVQERVIHLGCRLLPKAAITLVPINQTMKTVSPLTQSRPGQPAAILLDDDEAVRWMWETAASKAGILLRTFADADSFLNIIDHFDNNVECYIDAKLPSAVQGEGVVKILKDKGFKSVHLVTGYNKERFASMPWVGSVRDKAPPNEWNNASSAHHKRLCDV